MITLSEFSSSYRAKLILQVYKQWVKKGEKVLDVGCGNGVVSIFLKNELKVKLEGCDIDDYLSQDIKFTKMSRGNKLPFKNRSFDVVMFNDVLHHMSKKNQIDLIKESLRVGKKVLIFEVNPTFVAKIFDLFLNKIHNPRMNIPFTFRSIDDWQSLFEEEGYRAQVKIIRRPLLYPFSHVAFNIKNK